MGPLDSGAGVRPHAWDIPSLPGHFPQASDLHRPGWVRVDLPSLPAVTRWTHGCVECAVILWTQGVRDPGAVDGASRAPYTLLSQAMTSTTEAVSTENDPGNKSAVAVAVMSPWRRNRTWSVLPPIRMCGDQSEPQQCRVRAVQER